MPEVVFPLDSKKKFTEQQIVGHNRWHPDIPAQVYRPIAAGVSVRRLRRSC
jgi:hypothetical protein